MKRHVIENHFRFLIPSRGEQGGEAKPLHLRGGAASPAYTLTTQKNVHVGKKICL